MLKPLSTLEHAERQLDQALAPLQRSRRRPEPDNQPPSSLADLGVSVSEGLPLEIGEKRVDPLFSETLGVILSKLVDPLGSGRSQL